MAILEKQFINPYNFVQQGEKPKRIKISEYDSSETVTGCIDCFMEVADKLALPDHENVDKNIKKGASYDFYKINGVPVVPGSELKGCIRNLYETLTYSCYSVINANTLTKRIAVDWKKVSNPGIVKYNDIDNKWYIYPAKKIKKENRNSYQECDLVYRSWKSSPTFQKKTGIQYITQSYALDSANRTRIDCTSKMSGFEEIIEMFLKNNASDKKFCDCIKNLKQLIENKKSFVAFYLFNGIRLTYFSPGQFSRTAFDNKVTDFLGEYAPCTGDDDEYCNGCHLFGTLGKDKPIASRLRFGDATPVGNTVTIGKPDMLPAMSSPKITSIEFYSLHGIQFQDVHRWDYDDSGVTLRGRKFYFHSKAKSENGKSFDDLAPGQFKTACANKGSTFNFKVYFDKITKDDLGKLLWVLALGENKKDSSYMQKIGAGKPAGYGSVKITVNEVLIRKADTYAIEKKSYDELVADESVFDKKALDGVKLICDYNYLGENRNLVSYPIADDGNSKKTSVGSLQWFTDNRTTNGKFKQVLPTLSENPSKLLMNSRLPGNGGSTAVTNATGYKKETNISSNNKDIRPKISALQSDKHTLKCEICGRSEEVDIGTYKQRCKGGYKCRNCRGKK